MRHKELRKRVKDLTVKKKNQSGEGYKKNVQGIRDWWSRSGENTLHKSDISKNMTSC